MEWILSGLFLGLSGGLSPGPLSALLISETLRHGSIAGIKVALAPLFTDLPVLALALFVIARLPYENEILGALSIVGGVFLFYFGIEGLRKHDESLETAQKPNSLLRGILVNFSSPNPYIFWFTIASPILFKAQLQNPWLAPASFLLAFFIGLVGTKIVLALAIGKTSSLQNHSLIHLLSQILSLVLFAMGTMLIWDGILRFTI